MKITDAKALALSLMGEHGLIEQGWEFSFDTATRRFGWCHSGLKRISLSQSLTELNTEQEVKDTILHEIAHALVGTRQHHNAVWRAKAIAIGCSGDRCYDDTVITPPARYTATCKRCKNVVERQTRRKGVACGECCRKHNNGRWDAKYVLTFRKR